MISDFTPETFEQTINCFESDARFKAMQEEFHFMHANKTWNLVKKPLVLGLLITNGSIGSKRVLLIVIPLGKKLGLLLRYALRRRA